MADHGWPMEMKNRQYGMILRISAGILCAVFLLGVPILLWGVFSLSGLPKWTALLLIPFIIGMGLLFLDVSRRGEDPPWFYDMWDGPEDELKPSEQNAPIAQQPDSIKRER
ncbi:MAG: hypothetical protein HY922_02925 [Elusimicrobia bacterium]|nr:hypothetical protein [Elusimicrobiota bacterium]